MSKACLSTSRTCLFALLTGVLAAILCVTPYGRTLEEEIGLSWLFKLRGVISAPTEILIINIDRVSAVKLQLPDNPEKWPRSIYARLIDNLNHYHSAIIAFALVFDENRDAKNEQLLAEAMHKGNNVILSNYLKRYPVAMDGQYGHAFHETIVEPIAKLRQAAVTAAPFLLPKSSSSVKQFWTYKSSAGNIPTFPVSIFQHYAFQLIYPDFLHLVNLNSPSLLEKIDQEIAFPIPATGLTEKIDRLKILFEEEWLTRDQESSFSMQDFSPQNAQLLNSWLTLIQSDASLFLNHYGPALTFPTMSLYQALKQNEVNERLFKNKIILIGYSEDVQAEKSQGFYNVFSRSGTDAISPIEIAGTAVANLLQSAWIRPLQLNYQFLLILLWGVLLTGLYRWLTMAYATVLVIACSLIYLYIADTIFSIAYLWVPVTIPLAFQLPLLLFLVSITRYTRSIRDQENIQQTFSRYLPDDVVNQVTTRNYANQLEKFGELKYGVCMATDAGQYTSLSEEMAPMELGELMNNYYSVLFRPVKTHGGFISDVIGDAMLAIWAASTMQTVSRLNACKAALEISKAVENFNHSQSHTIPTRIGLHYGEIRLGNVGTREHFEYRAVGDIVNTAHRIEDLNKNLGTQILVSAASIHHLDEFIIREIGAFILRGKTKPIDIYELFSVKNAASEQELALLGQFDRALTLFKALQWQAALAAFKNIEKRYPNDGPTLFYINYLMLHPTFKQNTQDSAATIIKIQ